MSLKQMQIVTLSSINDAKLIHTGHSVSAGSGGAFGAGVARRVLRFFAGITESIPDGVFRAAS